MAVWVVPADMVRTHVAGADAPANVSVVLRRATWTVENFEESRRAWELPSWPLDDTMRQSGTYAWSYGVRPTPRSYSDMLKIERRNIELFVEECRELGLDTGWRTLVYDMIREPAPPRSTVGTSTGTRAAASTCRTPVWGLLAKELAEAICRGRFINRYLQRIEDEADSADSVFWASSTEETVVF